ncbi:SAM-dependent methyltransferase [Streptomyces hokutonensis]
MRTRAEFTAFFTGPELVDPGIELAARWHPELGGAAERE